MRPGDDSIIYYENKIKKNKHIHKQTKYIYT